MTLRNGNCLNNPLMDLLPMPMANPGHPAVNLNPFIPQEDCLLLESNSAYRNILEYVDNNAGTMQGTYYNTEVAENDSRHGSWGGIKIRARSFHMRSFWLMWSF